MPTEESALQQRTKLAAPITGSAKVLIFPVGTEISFELYAALRNEKWVELVGAAASGSSHAHFLFDRVFEVEHVAKQQWLPQIVDLCRREGVQFILPAHDDAVVRLGAAQTTNTSHHCHVGCWRLRNCPI